MHLIRQITVASVFCVQIFFYVLFCFLITLLCVFTPFVIIYTGNLNDNKVHLNTG